MFEGVCARIVVGSALQLNQRFAGWLAVWLVGRLARWLFDWMAGCLLRELFCA